MDSVTLSLHGIRKSFGGVEVLHGVDFDATGGTVTALLGENGAGKSTLVKILAGEYVPDSGAIQVGDETFSHLTPIRARRAGIRMISQEFQDAGTLTVAENISLGRWPTSMGVVKWKAMQRRAEEVLESMSVQIDPTQLVSDLRVGERQVVEIARALADESRVLILDEPTAALSQAEVQHLFTWVNTLRAQGVCIIYITHRLDEVNALSDRVLVLRNGSVALEEASSRVSRHELVEAMVGHEVAAAQRPIPTSDQVDGEVLIEVQGLTVGDQLIDVSFQARRSEVVAIYGKLGSGTSQVAEALFGLKQPSSGSISIRGQRTRVAGPRSAISAGVGYLPPDRKREGLLQNRPVVENLAAASWSKLAALRLFALRRREVAAFSRWVTPLRIKAHRPAKSPISALSGGNQQKVLLGRWLERGSQTLVLAEPTRGVDVGAREDIYAALRNVASQGRAVVIITSDYEEAVQAADRVLVLARGEVVGEYRGDQVTSATLIAAAGG